SRTGADRGQGTGPGFDPFREGPRRLAVLPYPIRDRHAMLRPALLSGFGRRPGGHTCDLTALGTRPGSTVERVEAATEACDVRHHPHLLRTRCRAAPRTEAGNGISPLSSYRAGTGRLDTPGRPDQREFALWAAHSHRVRRQRERSLCRR